MSHVGLSTNLPTIHVHVMMDVQASIFSETVQGNRL